MTTQTRTSLASASGIAAESLDLRRVADRIVIRDGRFMPEDLIMLYRKEALAIRVKNYFDEKACNEIVRRLGASPLYGHYVNAPAIARVAQAFFESQADNESRLRYERDAVKWIEQLRELCAPMMTPFDQFRLQLDEAWRPGARLMTHNAYKMFAGLARHFGEGAEAEPHQDVFAWDAPTSREAGELTTQWAMNVYLTTAEKGGKLDLWDISLSKPEYEERRIPDSYGVHRETLPEPVASLAPEVGELILFDAMRVHAVTKIEVGNRWTWSSFVGVRGATDELLIWS
jgi:hypothetical protein